MTSPQKSTIKQTITRTYTTSSYANIDVNKEAYNNEITNERNINRGLQAQLASYNDMVNDVHHYDLKYKESERNRDHL